MYSYTDVFSTFGRAIIIYHVIMYMPSPPLAMAAESRSLPPDGGSLEAGRISNHLGGNPRSIHTSRLAA